MGSLSQQAFASSRLCMRDPGHARAHALVVHAAVRTVHLSHAPPHMLVRAR